jgi:hypothetical protein
MGRVRDSSARGRATEPLLAIAGSLIAAILLLGSHVTDGGRYLDDWWLGVYVRFPHHLGFGSGFDYLNFYSGARPGDVAYWATTYKLFGFDDDLHRGLGVLLAAGLAAVFYLLLRELGLHAVEAAGTAALTLALPIADSIHFWITPDVAQLCLGTCVAGYLVALRGLRAAGSRAKHLQLASIGLFVVSALFAETMLPAIGLSVLIYRTRVGWRTAIARWIPDAAIVVVAGVHYALSEPRRIVGAPSHHSDLHHAGVLADQALALLTGTLVPFAHSRAAVLLGLLVLAGLLARRLRTPTQAPTRRWIVVAGLAAVFTLASYAIYVPSDPSYQPLVPGIGNRINIGMLLPLSILLFAIARLIGSLLGPARGALAATAVVWAIVFTGGAIRLEADHWLWDQAATHQATVIGAVHQALPDPPPGASLLVLNSPGVVTHFERIGEASVNQPVPVFSTWWELDAAVKLSYDRADLNAYPIWSYQPAQVACGAHSIYQLGLDSGMVRHALAYGMVYVIDVAAKTAVRLTDQARCSSVIATASTVRYDLPV